VAAIFTSWSGWILVVLLVVTITLPYLVRRHARSEDGRRPILLRLQPHYWLGYTIAAITMAHAALSTGTGLALHANATGVYLATGALLLVFAQVFLGLLLREPSVRRRTVMRQRHFWVMVGIVTLTLGHIALNSVLVHRLIG
jgi:hypothetical protein